MCLLARYLQQRYFYSAPPSGLRRFSQIHGRFQPHSKTGPMRAQKKVRGIGAPPSGFRRFSQIHGRFQPHSENGPVWARKKTRGIGELFMCASRGMRHAISYMPVPKVFIKSSGGQNLWPGNNTLELEYNGIN